MCGIAGFAVSDTLLRSGGAVLSAAMAEIRPRGPDMESMVGWDQNNEFVGNAELQQHPDLSLRLGLVHTRLFILDLSRCGLQPMQGRDGSWIVYNGEIYNYQELRRELADLGYIFATRTDTEVVLAAYAQWGSDCVARFNGMWAFALYDQGKKQLFCSRDRLGVKPFYWSRLGEKGFAFASTPEAVLLISGNKPSIDPGQLGRYLIARIDDDQIATIYQGVNQLEAGHNGFFALDAG